MTIRIILSDLGNVVLDFDYNLILNKLSGLSGLLPDNILEELFVKNDQPWFKFLRGKIGNEDFYGLCCNLFNFKTPVSYNEFREIICNIFKPNAQVFDLWRKLYAHGYRLVLLSNLDRMQRDWVMQYYRLPLFEECIWSCEVGHIKPDKEIYEIALAICASRFKAKPDEIVFVDDRKENIEAAKLFGIHTVHYDGDDEKLVADLRALGVIV